MGILPQLSPVQLGNLDGIPFLICLTKGNLATGLQPLMQLRRQMDYTALVALLVVSSLCGPRVPLDAKEIFN
jgi:hypothetical protein